MEDDSTTAAGNSVTDGTQATTDTESITATDSQTANTNSDNLDTSKATDTSATDDTKSNTDGEVTPAYEFDADLDDWAKNTNRAIPETDRERALYQEIRDGQREFSRSQQAKDADKSVSKAIQEAKPADQESDEDEEDPVERLERQFNEERSTRARSEYFVENSVTAKESDIMGEILKEKITRATTQAEKQSIFDYWTNPNQLADWHELAKARLATNPDIALIEQEAARKERERIAKESSAAGPSRNATVPTAKPGGYNRTEFLKSDD